MRTSTQSVLIYASAEGRAEHLNEYDAKSPMPRHRGFWVDFLLFRDLMAENVVNAIQE